MNRKFLKMYFVFLIFSMGLTFYAGGGSDGGGNTYRNKPLESYAKDPTELQAFKNFITPILKDIESKQSTENELEVLKNLFGSVFKQKIWYFVPGPLEQVPVDLLKSAVRTDQAALQGFDRVWIDEDIWNNIKPEDQARLLLHEVFMGLKILGFGSAYRQCHAAYPNSSHCNDSDHMDLTIALLPDDYLDIQKSTIQVFTSFSRMGNIEWVKMLNTNNMNFRYNWFDEVTFIDPQDLSKLLKQSTFSGFLPTIGYNLRTIDSRGINFTNPKEMLEFIKAYEEVCNISAHVTGNILNLKLISPTEHFEGAIPLPPKIEVRNGEMFSENRKLKKIGIAYKTKQLRPTGGFTLYNIWLGFNFFELSAVFIQEMVCEDENCAGEPEIDAKNGMLYSCRDSRLNPPQ